MGRSKDNIIRALTGWASFIKTADRSTGRKEKASQYDVYLSVPGPMICVSYRQRISPTSTIGSVGSTDTAHEPQSVLASDSRRHSLDLPAPLSRPISTTWSMIGCWISAQCQRRMERGAMRKAVVRKAPAVPTQCAVADIVNKKHSHRYEASQQLMGSNCNGCTMTVKWNLRPTDVWVFCMPSTVIVIVVCVC